MTDRVLDVGLRVVGLLVAVGLAAVSAIYEAFLTPLYWHGSRLPLALLLAIVGNAGLAWFTREVTGRIGAVFVPAALWVFLIFLAGTNTRERDLVLTGKNWVGVATMLTGAVVFGVVGYGMVFQSLRRRQLADKPLADNPPLTDKRPLTDKG